MLFRENLFYSIHVDFYFKNEEEIESHFSKLKDLFSTKINLYKLNIRTHWGKETFQKSFKESIHNNFIKFRRNIPFDINVILHTPFCIDKDKALFTYPNCQNCAFLEGQWCYWPRQFSDYFYSNAQKRFNPKQFEFILKSDFNSATPLTWFTPKKKQIQNIADFFKDTDAVVDFGSGNGFISYLVLKNLLPYQTLYGIDPFFNAKIPDKNFSHLVSLPKLKKSWSLLSSLADFSVPVEKCFHLENLPLNIVFICFPDVFGKGGEEINLQIKNNSIKIKNKKSLFDFNILKNKGYSLVHREPIYSNYFQNTEILFYSKDNSKKMGLDNKFKKHTSKLKYHWEL